MTQEPHEQSPDDERLQNLLQTMEPLGARLDEMWDAVEARRILARLERTGWHCRDDRDAAIDEIRRRVADARREIWPDLLKRIVILERVLVEGRVIFSFFRSLPDYTREVRAGVYAWTRGRATWALSGIYDYFDARGGPNQQRPTSVAAAGRELRSLWTGIVRKKEDFDRWTDMAVMSVVKTLPVESQQNAIAILQELDAGTTHCL